VTIHNHAYLKWVEAHGESETEAAKRACDDAGAMTVVVGKHPECIEDEDNWPGHLTVIVPKVFLSRHAMLDLTIVQASKPEWGIVLGPFRIQASDRFVTGQCLLAFNAGRSKLIYEAYPDDHSYQDDGDLMAIDDLDRVAANIIQRMRTRRIVD
jgi:hypothetical protein